MVFMCKYDAIYKKPLVAWLPTKEWINGIMGGYETPEPDFNDKDFEESVNDVLNDEKKADDAFNDNRTTSIHRPVYLPKSEREK
jgi:hypothetical protein